MHSTQPNIIIVDYGLGNMFSLVKAFGHFGITARVTEEPSTIREADGLILPGVGAFEAGMHGLRIRHLVDVLQQCAAESKPILGICLGAQLLMDTGYEFGQYKGLGIIPGSVVTFPKLQEGTKIPHIGWNSLIQPRNQKWRKSILSSLPNQSSVYFVHSFIVQPTSRSAILATTDYGGHTFCSVINQGTIYGCQFHPEKSGSIGLQIIQNFITLVSSEKHT